MIAYKADYKYVISKNTKLFTAVLLPNENEQFPSVVIRTPYVDALEALTEQEICARYALRGKRWHISISSSPTANISLF